MCALSWTIKEKLRKVNSCNSEERQPPSRQQKQASIQQENPTSPLHAHSSKIYGHAIPDCRVGLIGKLGDVLTTCLSRPH